ncbi:TPA: hypothetical protein LT039_004254 [Salmonella enterica subsp. enterica serovar Sternschanze]|nr:hypothetical protein [Salmonella enterica subsp. enterica serovar Sternschanze]
MYIYLKYIQLGLLFCVLAPAYCFSYDVNELNVNESINKNYDISTPHDITILDKGWTGSFPDGEGFGTVMGIACFSEDNPETGACPSKVKWGSGSAKDSLLLRFTEKRTGLQHVAIVKGSVVTACGRYDGFVGGTYGCYDTIKYTIYLPESSLKEFPVGGVWTAHLKLNVETSNSGPTGAVWNFDIVLHATDNKNIKIWLPQFHGSTANVVMPVMPAYWAFNKPGQVSAEKVIETCLYDGYSSNSKSFEVTLNSNYTEPATQDFLLQNSSAPTSKPLHYQVIASPPGQAGTMQRLKPGVTQTYVGINTANIRQVLMPGLQTPVACVPWPIRIKLLPFDLSRQAAGHYSGTLSIIFTPSLD